MAATTQITAVNKKHQAVVNRFITWDHKYDVLVNENDVNSTSKGERLQARAYEKASELWQELPKREQTNIIKTLPGVKGSY